ncbi:hypothetical protein K9U39_06370 [Rhodoblastus acidophilus]|uniref:Uncharacterized protein n=1 Tax=Candidatus Rhodoblastus alkanivorans TaxID=2954117 RepID=A0ABS9Z897_9HYPH|nr:hypothetical protein [Candidatus Rhodoblastus alkanivorans]MCI4679672.1 hypothetical protein [Candidatus Rhodoblastus alkanivorans]MCI4683266.1 hypothetical protein [Candidatus Rhodoblastus alkanivorans]MDI4640578.1 hypothetical protein [Rhodoblastus acidophilus]
MTDSKSDNYIEIPEEARRVKPDFVIRPTSGVVKEIKQRIKDGNPPYLDPYHTHTKPLPNSKPIYLGEFDLPEKDIKAGRLSPCPCCSPEHPKYGRKGKIAWFPSEHVIRLLGPDCFGKMDKGAHEQAVAEFKREQQREHDVRYLLGNEARLRRAEAALLKGQEMAAAIDALGKDLRHKIYDVMDIPLWPHIKKGMLQRWEQRTEMVGWTGTNKEIDVLIDHARLHGYRLLDPEAKSLANSFSGPIQAFRILNEHANWNDFVIGMTDVDRHNLAVLLNNSRKAADKAREHTEQMRQLISTVSLATLRAWGMHPGCPCPIHVEFNNEKIFVGKTAFITVHSGIPAVLASGDQVPSIDLPDIKVA